MKTIKSIAILLGILNTISACAPKMSFSTSTVVPSATGTVSVKKDRNKNYVVNVNVRNLADPKRLDPAKNTYLVWMESSSEPVKKLGKIMPSGRALEGKLTATATDNPKEVFITAEDDAEVMNPGGQTILTTRK